MRVIGPSKYAPGVLTKTSLKMSLTSVGMIRVAAPGRRVFYSRQQPGPAAQVGDPQGRL